MMPYNQTFNWLFLYKKMICHVLTNHSGSVTDSIKSDMIFQSIGFWWGIGTVKIVENWIRSIYSRGICDFTARNVSRNILCSCVHSRPTILWKHAFFNYSYICICFLIKMFPLWCVHMFLTRIQCKCMLIPEVFTTNKPSAKLEAFWICVIGTYILINNVIGL